MAAFQTDEIKFLLPGPVGDLELLTLAADPAKQIAATAIICPETLSLATAATMTFPFRLIQFLALCQAT